MNRNYSLMLIVLLGFVLTVSFSYLAEADSRDTDFATTINSRSLFLNPAAERARENKFSLNFRGEGELWNNLMENSYMSDSRKDSLLSGIKSEGWVLGSNASFGPSLHIGPVGVFGGLREEAVINFPYDVGELLLKGNETDEKYVLDNTEGKFGLYGDMGFNISLKIPEKYSESLEVQSLFAGFNYHYLQGIIGEVTGDGEMSIYYNPETEEPDFEGSGEFDITYYDPQESNMATGSALDLGLYSEINEKWSTGFSILNLGSIKGTGLERTYEADSEGDLSSDNDPDELPEETMEWKLPYRIKLGATYSFKNYLDFSGNYTRTSYDNGLKDNNFGLGTEFTYINFLPLRLSGTYSTLKNSLIINSGLRLHLGPARTDISIENVSGLFNRSKSAAIKLNNSISF